MKAFVLKAPGPAEMLQLVTLPTPDIKTDEVLVEVKAIAFNPIDVKTRMGIGLYPRLAAEQPLILGWDISGIVVDTGAQVTDFKKGDEVFGMINFPGHGKAYAEYVACKARHLAKKPPLISHPEAAASCLAALTAWQALTSIAKIKKNDRLLVHAAAGGVGHFAIQIARQLGAYVIGTCSTANIDFVRSLGAQQVIDYQSVAFEKELHDLDIVLDAIGGSYIERSLPTLRKGGTYICLPSNNSQGVVEKSKDAGVLGYTMLVHSSGTDMQILATWLDKKFITPHISRIFSFEEIPMAHRHLETGRTVGKIVALI
ncbi:MAG: NADP-dependent oxidoreductase [Bacteroidales bacterium]